jgi:hypothetical protein
LVIDIDFFANQARPMAMEYAICNGFGFGGVNASALFRRWTDGRSKLTPGKLDDRALAPSCSSQATK